MGGTGLEPVTPQLVKPTRPAPPGADMPLESVRKLVHGKLVHAAARHGKGGGTGLGTREGVNKVITRATETGRNEIDFASARKWRFAAGFSATPICAETRNRRF